MGTARLLAFVAVVFGLSIVIHLYVGRRLLAPFDLGPTTTRLVYAALVLHALAMPAVFLTIPSTGAWWADAFQYLGYLGMGFFSLVFVLLLFRDAGLLALDVLARVVPIEAPFEPARRAFLSRSVSLLILGVAGAIGGVAWLQAKRRPTVEDVSVPIDGLPAALDGFRIAQISDLHAGPAVQEDAFEDIVATINALGVDLVAVTGDLVDGSVGRLARHVAPLAGLKSRHGTYFVTGNHEYYSGVEPWCVHCESLGMVVLNNRHVVLDHDGAALTVAGVTDQRAGAMAEGHACDPRGALRDAPESIRVLLAHQPTTAYAAAKLGAHLQLSGHTHAGQYFPFTWLARLVLPFARGLHRVGTMWLYVNRGTTFWGPPMRLDAEQEITVLQLRAAE